MHIIIGHRGTGKSHWLKLIKEAHQGQKILCLDLDKEVEKASKQNVFQLFQKGESHFREWEKKVFARITKAENTKGFEKVFVAVGAGFQFEKTKDMEVICLGRTSDSQGRVFLDRPLLNPKSRPLEESLDLYHKREKEYLKQADEVFYRREHFKDLQLSDLLFLGLKEIKSPCYILRLNPENLPKDKSLLKKYLNKRLCWGIRFFELNDETADLHFVKTVQDIVPNEKLLFSSQKSRLFCSVKGKKNWSWDLSLGEPPEGVSVLSLHDRGEQALPELLNSFSSYKNQHLKLAIEIRNLKELWEAHSWREEDLPRRSFLPRSFDGRWRWYRIAHPMPLQFFREGRGGVLDQPFFSEVCYYSEKSPTSFAAVLGHPIDFSATPSEQDQFFYKQRSIPVLAVPLKEEEMTKENLTVFQKLGFVFFAITSPLKKKAYLLASQISDKEVHKWESINTLICHKEKWLGYNTDEQGLSSLKLLNSLKENCVVWGGGGTRKVIEKYLPSASFYSARKGQLLSGRRPSQVKALVWAVGRKRMKQSLWPPKNGNLQKFGI